MWAYTIAGVILGILGGATLKGILNHKNKLSVKIKFLFAVVVSIVLIIICEDYTIRAKIFAGLLSGFIFGIIFGSKGYVAPQNIEKSIELLNDEIRKAKEEKRGV